MNYAELVVNRHIVKYSSEIAEAEINPLALTFHYHIPDDMLGLLKPGLMVAVPFRNQQLTAVVLALSDSSPVEITKPITAILDPVPVLTEAQIKLAYWLSYTYLTPLSICVRYFMPPGSNRKPELVLKAVPNSKPSALNAQEQILLTYLDRYGSAKLANIEQSVAESLIKKGLAYKESVLSRPHIGAKIDKTVELLISPDEIEAVLPTLGRASKQADILLYLAGLDDPLPLLANVLAEVGCSTKSPLDGLVKKGLVQIITAQMRVVLPLDVEAVTSDETEQKLLDYLAEQSLPPTLDELIAATSASKKTVTALIKKNLLIRLDEPAHVMLIAKPNDLTPAIIQLRHSQKYVDVLNLLAEEDSPIWVGWVYAQTEANIQILRRLAKDNLVSIAENRHWRDPMEGYSFTLDSPHKLTAEQEAILQTVFTHHQTTHPKPILLHGVTGSGKTEIYLRMIEATLKQGRGAIMLVPEITLAVQAVKRVAARFPEQVAVWHSALSPGERYDSWERVRAGELPIVVGPRSAIFAPVKNLGVIIIDEEHEPAYKQSNRSPRFHARETAIELSRLSQSLLIMGSATPDVVTYRKAERDEYQLLSLPSRVLAHTKHLAVQETLIKRHKGRIGKFAHHKDIVSLPMPQVEVVDLRKELRDGNRTIFSRVLQTAIHETLRRGEQVILFLNRRGAASFVICRDCGYVVDCPDCDNSLTYHSSGDMMRCHYCGYNEQPPKICPECHNNRIRYFGLGTQKVEQAVKTMFPQAQTIRWDFDTTRRKGSHNIFLERFMSGQANIMIGTQMVAKGLDLPLVTLVGVISADTALYLPDFRAGERTFQLLTQVAGRAGRSPLGGRVIVQTYSPDKIYIQAAAAHDYDRFYRFELKFRQENHYPPFKRVAILFYTGAGRQHSQQEAEDMTRRLKLHIERQGLPAVKIIGPTPDYIQWVGSQYRWHIIIRAKNPTDILRPFLPFPKGWRVDIDSVTLL